MSRKRPAPRTGAATQPELWPGAADEPAGSAGPSCPVQPERDVRRKRAQRGQITWGRVDLDARPTADRPSSAQAWRPRRRRRLARPHGHRRGQADLQAARGDRRDGDADAKAHRGMAATARRGLDKITGTAGRFALTYNILRFITVSA
jgi:hypothetical protein